LSHFILVFGLFFSFSKKIEPENAHFVPFILGLA
jgi:hypothetical protein